MTSLWAYAAKLPPDGKLDWGGNWQGNIPPAQDRLLPDLGSAAFFIVADLATKGEYDGRQVDWGAHALKLDAPSLRAVLALIGPRGGPHMNDYSALADRLAPGEKIALVAAEL
jgi:hypothetical protein